MDEHEHTQTNETKFNSRCIKTLILTIIGLERLYEVDQGRLQPIPNDVYISK